MGYIYLDANIALNVTCSLKFIEMKRKKSNLIILLDCCHTKKYYLIATLISSKDDALKVKNFEIKFINMVPLLFCKKH